MSDTVDYPCAGCQHWERAGQYRWGSCMAPLPSWDHNDSPIIHPGDDYSADCACYTPPESADPVVGTVQAWIDSKQAGGQP